MIPGPQVVKTHIRPSEKLSPAAQQAVFALHGLIANGEDPAVLEAQTLSVQQIVAVLLRTAGRFHEGESALEEIMGAMLAAAAWIAHHHGVEFVGGDDPPRH